MTKLKKKMKMKKNVLKLKKQNEKKLEDIICNTYSVLLKFSPCNYQIFIFVKIKNDLRKKKKMTLNSPRQYHFYKFNLAWLIQTAKQYDWYGFKDCLLHIQSTTTQQSEQTIL